MRDPACWSWPIPPMELPPHLAGLSRAAVDLMGLGAVQYNAFHAGRCAVCGCGGRLLDDHDHETGLRRGYLCPSCNGREGTRYGDRGGEVMRKYRERNPASILGYVEPYLDPWTGEFASGQ